MADSENSRTLPLGTPENLHSSTTDFLTGATNRSFGANFHTDPVLAKWLTWHEAYHKFALLCRLQQQLETRLFNTVGSPAIQVEVPGLSHKVTVESDEEIEHWLNEPDMAEAQDKAKEALSVQRDNWEAADQLAGYSRALEAESAASELEQNSAQALWNTPAHSVEGAIAKLHVVLTSGVLSPDCQDFPWPSLRAIMTDLLTIAQARSEAPARSA